MRLGVTSIAFLVGVVTIYRTVESPFPVRLIESISPQELERACVLFTYRLVTDAPLNDQRDRAIFRGDDLKVIVMTFVKRRGDSGLLVRPRDKRTGCWTQSLAGRIWFYLWGDAATSISDVGDRNEFQTAIHNVRGRTSPEVLQTELHHGAFFRKGQLDPHCSYSEPSPIGCDQIPCVRLVSVALGTPQADGDEGVDRHNSQGGKGNGLGPLFVAPLVWILSILVMFVGFNKPENARAGNVIIFASMAIAVGDVLWFLFHM